MKRLITIAAVTVVCLAMAGCQNGRIPPASMCLEEYAPQEIFNETLLPELQDWDLDQ